MAEKENIPFILSGAANMTIEDVARHCDGEKWFQLYVVHFELAKQLIKRAPAAGYATLIITVDVAVNGYQERDIRNQFCLPLRYRSAVLLDGCLHPSWLLRFLRNGMPHLLKEDIERTLVHIGSPSVRELTPNFVHNGTVGR